MKETETFFDTLADRWDEICTHDENKLKYIIDKMNIQRGNDILDIGCGTGILEKYMLPYLPEKIIGVDISKGMINAARLKYQTPIVDFIHEDIMDVQDTVFDRAIAYSVYPHFDEPDQVIRHIASLIKPKGTFIIAHSESRIIINSLHHKQAKRLSDVLPPVEELAKKFEPYFIIDFMEDNDQLYIISGIKK